VLGMEAVSRPFQSSEGSNGVCRHLYLHLHLQGHASYQRHNPTSSAVMRPVKLFLCLSDVANDVYPGPLQQCATCPVGL
jgi:hypothetical protein